MLSSQTRDEVTLMFVCLSVQEGRLYVLVSLMLSSQTRDEVNHAAMGRLREAGLSLAWLTEVPEQELGELIRPVGFWRVGNGPGVAVSRGPQRSEVQERDPRSRDPRYAPGATQPSVLATRPLFPAPFRAGVSWKP